ncbi:MAG: hypothetical protein AAB802_00640 [Patescibacteria group bacterium]
MKTRLLLALALAACDPIQEKKLDESPDQKVERLEEQRSNVSKQVDTILEKKADLGIPREDIASKLPELLEGFGKVIISPENFDPKKPNLYLVANQHFPPNASTNRKVRESILLTQRQGLQIAHTLVSLGADTQFLEGVGAGLELRHDVNYSDQLGEWPQAALPTYRKTGEINRSYIAAEGIYEDELTSLGVEDHEKIGQAAKEFSELDQRLFPQARQEIILNLASALGITGNSSDLNGLRAQIQVKAAQLQPDEINNLVATYVLTNAKYRAFLDVAVKFYFEKYRGRNERFAAHIHERMQEKPSDGFFIVGAQHAEELSGLLKGMNVFVVSPNTIPQEKIDFFAANYNDEDYKRTILDWNLYIFGLKPKPNPTFFSE